MDEDLYCARPGDNGKVSGVRQVRDSVQRDRPRTCHSEMGTGESAGPQRHAHGGIHAVREAVRHDGQHRDHPFSQAQRPIRGHRQGNALRLRRLVRLSEDARAAEPALGGRGSLRTRGVERPAEQGEAVLAAVRVGGKE